jgi:hypothetical protein
MTDDRLFSTEGPSRRFALEDAFEFKDFTNPELRNILDSQLKMQELSATDTAKDVAMELLSRERNRPTFGNGGAVEYLLGQAKTRHIARIRGSRSPSVVVFEPQDFDPDFDRHLHADQNLDRLFEGIIGCKHIIDKMREYQKIARVMKARGEDARGVIPTNFIFKGPPGVLTIRRSKGHINSHNSGTGKTTIARKIGQIYYEMGFLSSPKVEECSVSDLIGEYLGQTGPKTKKLFEKALGQVLLIDEAYRLCGDRFGQEAVDELVGLLTQDRFESKIVVILAGYEHDINKLLHDNRGLSSRFPEVISFVNISPKECIKILDEALRRKKVILPELRNPSSNGYSTLGKAVKYLSRLPLWANARDMETLAKRMISLVLTQLPESGQSNELILHVNDAVNVLRHMLDEQRCRSGMPSRSHLRCQGLQEELSSSTPNPNPPPAPVATQHPPPPPQERQRKETQIHQKSISRPSLPIPPPPHQSSSHTTPRPYPDTPPGSALKSRPPRMASSSQPQLRKKPFESQPLEPHIVSAFDTTWQQFLADQQSAQHSSRVLDDEIRYESSIAALVQCL